MRRMQATVLLILVCVFAGFDCGYFGPAFANAGGDESLDIKRIVPGLLLDADAVIRLNLHKFVVENTARARESVRLVITIMNEKGRDFGQHVIPYDKFRTVKKVQGLIRNPDGSVYRKLKQDEIADYSATAAYSLYDDTRIRVVELYHDHYPYTIELEYELERKGLINWTTWYPQRNGQPLEKGKFELVLPLAMDFRFQPRNLQAEPKITQMGDKKSYVWEVVNLTGLSYEPYSPPWPERVPTLIVAPNKFEIEGHAGDMSSWGAFAAWYYRLGEGRDALPPAVRQEVREITAGVQSPVERARKLYEYLQKNTRYTSIQLGIGGWQPFDATYVFEKGYGDCKALSNYMLAILKAADVPAFPALTRLGTNETDVLADFPSNQFNHVILFVPTPEDTVWLECTSQTMPFAHIGAANEDRNVLVVTPDSGKIVRTPASLFHRNRQVRRAVVTIDARGNGHAQVTTTFTGNQQDRVRQALAQSSGRDRDAWLRNRIDIPRFRLLKVDFSDVDRQATSISLPMELELPRYASVTGSRLFLGPNLMERWQHVPDEVEERTQPVHFAYTYEDVDSVAFHLPAGYKVEAMPEDVRLVTDFGLYEATIKMPDANSLVYRRALRKTKDRLPPEEYAAYREFVSKIVKADRAQIVLVRQ